MNWKILPLVILTGMLVTSGCLRVEPGSDAPTNVGFYGELNATDTEFTMDGQVILGGALPDQDVFRDVTIYLFTENGTLIRAHAAGDLRRPLNVTLNTDRVPHYVIIDSPEFWAEDHINVRYYRRIDVDGPRDYGQSEVQSRDGFPVTLPATNRSVGDLDERSVLDRLIAGARGRDDAMGSTGVSDE